MGLDTNGDIAVGQLIAYIPALIASIYVGFRHGFAKEDGWYFFIIMSILHLVGSLLEIIGELQNPQDLEVMGIGLGLAGAGTSSLLNATLAILKRLQSGMKNPVLQPHTFNMLQIVPVIALILVTYGSATSSDSDPSKASTGHTLGGIGYVVLFLFLLVEGGMGIMTWPRRDGLRPGDNKLLYAVLIAVPFAGLRIIYGIISAFSWNNTSSPFNRKTPNVPLEVGMSLIAEYIVVVVYLVAAVFAPKIQGEQQVYSASGEDGYGYGGSRYGGANGQYQQLGGQEDSGYKNSEQYGGQPAWGGQQQQYGQPNAPPQYYQQQQQRGRQQYDDDDYDMPSYGRGGRRGRRGGRGGLIGLAINQINRR